MFLTCKPPVQLPPLLFLVGCWVVLLYSDWLKSGGACKISGSAIQLPGKVYSLCSSVQHNSAVQTSNTEEKTWIIFSPSWNSKYIVLLSENDNICILTQVYKQVNKRLRWVPRDMAKAAKGITKALSVSMMTSVSLIKIHGFVLSRISLSGGESKGFYIWSSSPPIPLHYKHSVCPSCLCYLTGIMIWGRNNICKNGLSHLDGYVLKHISMFLW